MGANGEVVSLHMAGADPVLVGRSMNRALLDAYYRGGAVPPLVFPGGGAVLLDDLSVVNASPEVVTHRFGVGVETVSRQLEVARGGTPQLFAEGVSMKIRTAAQLMSEDELAFAVEGSPAPGIAHTRVEDAVLPLGLLLHADKAPDLVALNVGDFDLGDQPIQQLGAAVTDGAQQPADGVAVGAGDSLDSANAGALDQQIQHQDGPLHRDAMVPQGTSGTLREGRTALLAAVALVSVLVLAPLDGRTAAGAQGVGVVVGGGHGFVSLDLEV